MTTIKTAADSIGQKPKRKRKPTILPTYRELTLTKEGWLSICYSRMSYRVRYRDSYKGRLVEVGRAEFIQWAICRDDFNTIYDAWDCAGRPKKTAPSIDRIDPAGGYSFDNMQFLTQSENVKKGNRDNTKWMRICRQMGLAFNEMIERLCLRCKTVKPLVAFGSNTYARQGKVSYCKSCVNEDALRRRMAKRSEVLAKRGKG